MQDGAIFVIGGLKKTESNDEQPTAIQDCVKIDKYLQLSERTPMELPRFNAPLCLIRGRFILALGGYIAIHNITQKCEVYDSSLNHWFPMADLPIQFINSTAVVMNHRTVYLMPGDNN